MHFFCIRFPYLLLLHEVLVHAEAAQDSDLDGVAARAEVAQDSDPDASLLVRKLRRIPT